MCQHNQCLYWVNWEWIWSHITGQRRHVLRNPVQIQAWGNLHPWTGSMWARYSTGEIIALEYQSWSLPPPAWIWGQNCLEVVCYPYPVFLTLLLGNPLNGILGKNESSQRALERWAVEGQPWIIGALKLHCSLVVLITFVVALTSF